MLQHKQVNPVVSLFDLGRISQIFQIRVLLHFETWDDFVLPLVPDIALLEYEWRILFQIPPAALLFLLSILIYDIHFDLFDCYDFFAFNLLVQLDSLSGFLGNHVIQLPCEVFTRKAKVLRKDDISEDVFSVPLFQGSLVVFWEVFVDSLGLVKD